MGYCVICEQEKDPMDMNAPGLCKKCFSIQQDIRDKLDVYTQNKSNKTKVISTTHLTNKYIAMRKAYISAGNRLERLNQTFLDLMKQMDEIKMILTRGWGYKKE